MHGFGIRRRRRTSMWKGYEETFLLPCLRSSEVARVPFFFYSLPPRLKLVHLEMHDACAFIHHACETCYAGRRGEKEIHVAILRLYHVKTAILKCCDCSRECTGPTTLRWHSLHVLCTSSGGRSPDEKWWKWFFLKGFSPSTKACRKADDTKDGGGATFQSQIQYRVGHFGPGSI